MPRTAVDSWALTEFNLREAVRRVIGVDDYRSLRFHHPRISNKTATISWRLAAPLQRGGAEVSASQASSAVVDLGSEPHLLGLYDRSSRELMTLTYGARAVRPPAQIPATLIRAAPSISGARRSAAPDELHPGILGDLELVHISDDFNDYWLITTESLIDVLGKASGQSAEAAIRRAMAKQRPDLLSRVDFDSEMSQVVIRCTEEADSLAISHLVHELARKSVDPQR
jgi:hypothetical protein